jgi:hypothetical protein
MAGASLNAAPTPAPERVLLYETRSVLASNSQVRSLKSAKIGATGSARHLAYKQTLTKKTTKDA